MRATNCVAAAVNDTTQALETALGHTFRNPEHLLRALSHRSIGAQNNERLEYLGDALLGFIIADFLFHLHPHASEGDLTRLRAALVKGETLARLARSIGLGQYLRLGSSELKSGGWRRTSILANTMEALIGAIYLDSGMDDCRRMVQKLYADLLENSSPADLIKDAKTRLQEYLQARQLNLPVYAVVSESGEAHNRIFVVRCDVTELAVAVEATGPSKRFAEQSAAKLVLDKLDI